MFVGGSVHSFRIVARSNILETTKILSETTMFWSFTKSWNCVQCHLQTLQSIAELTQKDLVVLYPAHNDSRILDRKVKVKRKWIPEPFFMLMVSVANIRGSQSIRHFGCFCNNFSSLNFMAIISIWSQVISWRRGNQNSIFCHWIVWSVTSS